MSTMEYANVRLRPWRPGDAEELIAIAKCAHVQAWLQDWADVEEWAEPWIKGQAWRHELGAPLQEFMSWAITAPPSDKPIGMISVGGDDMDKEGVSIAYFLHEDALHKGYASQAAEAMVRYTFSRWDFPEIWASVQEENQASRAVLERTGFSLSHSSPTVFPGFDEAVSCAWYVRKR